MGQSCSFKRPGPAPCVDKVQGPACLIRPGTTAAFETLTAPSLPRTPFICPYVVSKWGKLSLLYLKPFHAVPSLLDSRPCMEWPLPTLQPHLLPSSPPALLSLSSPLHTLFPLLPVPFLTLFTGPAPLYPQVSAQQSFPLRPHLTVHVPLCEFS